MEGRQENSPKEVQEIQNNTNNLQGAEIGGRLDMHEDMTTDTSIDSSSASAFLNSGELEGRSRESFPRMEQEEGNDSNGLLQPDSTESNISNLGSIGSASDNELRLPLLRDSAQGVCVTPRRFLLRQELMREERSKRLRKKCCFWCIGIALVGLSLCALLLLLPRLPTIEFKSDSDERDGIHSGSDGYFCNGTETIVIRNPNAIPIRFWGATMTVLYQNFDGDYSDLGHVEAIDGNVHHVVPGHGSKSVTIGFNLGPLSESLFDTCFTNSPAVELSFVGQVEVENLAGRRVLQWGPERASLTCHTD